MQTATKLAAHELYCHLLLLPILFDHKLRKTCGYSSDRNQKSALKHVCLKYLCQQQTHPKQDAKEAIPGKVI